MRGEHAGPNSASTEHDAQAAAKLAAAALTQAQVGVCQALLAEQDENLKILPDSEDLSTWFAKGGLP